jgi:lysophospholipid acyltransferase 7
VTIDDFDYKTIHNIDEYGVETAPTVKTVLHFWNESVQYWMASYVYKRVFWRPIGQAWTMFVSAYWHGLHPGYYMSMLTCTPGIWAETYMDKGFKQRFMSPKHFYLFDLFTWFCRSRLFDYMSMGFILLDYNTTIRFWSSVYFIGHVHCVVFTILGFLLCQLPKPKAKKEL